MLIKYKCIMADIRKAELTPAESCLLLQILAVYQQYGVPEHGVDISKKELTEITGAGEHVVLRARKELESKGFIRYKQEATTTDGRALKRKKGTIKLSDKYLMEEEALGEYRERKAKRATKNTNNTNEGHGINLDRLII